VGTVRERAEGFVLAGGRNSRFGSDKFAHLVDGRSMGERAVDALAGLGSVTVVGPRRDSTQEVNWWMGSREGDGPLGALIDVLERTGSGIAVVLACDYPHVNQLLVEHLVASLGDDVDAAIANDGRPHWLVGAWRAERAVRTLRSSWDAGERSLHRAASGLEVIAVTAESAVLINANRKADVGA